MQTVKGKQQDRKLSYIECDKGGFHFGEVLNMVCVEPSCLEDLACCCACIQETHKKHTTKPLKMVMKEAKSHSDKLKPTKFNVDVIIDIMKNNQRNTLQKFRKERKQIDEIMDQIEKSLVNYYGSVMEQIKLKNCDPQQQIRLAFQAIYNPTKIESFKSSIKKMVSIIPAKDQDDIQLSEEELIDSINTSNEQIQQTVSKQVEDVHKKLNEYNASLNKDINTKNIWTKAFYKFSLSLKHNDVKLINEYTVKSSNSSGYKFAIMEPNLQKGVSVKTFTFKIKQCSSNWVAVGMCHANIVKNKNYAFNFSNLGHGGYLVSANGGSWSNTKSQANNTVKAFKFGKNDIITCTADFETKKMIFKKKNESYELGFQKINGDQLHPCALFYYMNDQVQFLPNYKPE